MVLSKFAGRLFMMKKMRPKLKINQINNLHDARYCSAVGIELLAFNLDKHDFRFIEPAKVKEIMEWLSGPESVGEFGEVDFAEIHQTAIELGLNYISLPADFEEEIPADLPFGLVFRWVVYDAVDMSIMLDAASNYPKAYFELRLMSSEDISLEFLQKDGLLPRTILVYDNPSSIYHWLEKEGTQVFGFALGDFIEDPAGDLDYQTCDDFVEQFNEMVLA